MASPIGEPAAVALKLTTTLQVAPAARVDVQVEEASSVRSAPWTPVIRPVRDALAVTVTVAGTVAPTG
jgi:hypothetical protein